VGLQHAKFPISDFIRSIVRIGRLIKWNDGLNDSTRFVSYRATMMFGSPIGFFDCTPFSPIN